jgi:hypothetical protein
MVAGVALDPSDIVNKIAAGADRISDPPRLLRHPPGVSPPLPALRTQPVVAGLGGQWERLGGSPSETSHAIQARFRRWARRVVGRLQRPDRALLGDLVRALETTAARTDELADRLARLETLVEEVVEVFSEDLVHLRAVLDALPPAVETKRSAASPDL